MAAAATAAAVGRTVDKLVPIKQSADYYYYFYHAFKQYTRVLANGRGQKPLTIKLREKKGDGSQMEVRKTLFAYTKHVSDIHRRDAKQLVAKCLLFFWNRRVVRKFQNTARVKKNLT